MQYNKLISHLQFNKKNYQLIYIKKKNMKINKNYLQLFMNKKNYKQLKNYNFYKRKKKMIKTNNKE